MTSLAALLRCFGCTELRRRGFVLNLRILLLELGVCAFIRKRPDVG